MTSDLKSAESFYTELFGWETGEMDMGEGFKYTTYRPAGATPDNSSGGMMQMTPEMGDFPPFWLSYVLVEDIAASLEKAKSLGATVMKPVCDIGMGKLCVINDPQGAMIALWENKG